MFILETTSGKLIQLKWGIYAMKLFSTRRNLPNTIGEILKEMALMSQDIDIAVAVFQSASEYATGNIPEYKEVCEWIDDCGGLLAQSGSVYEFGKYLMSTMGLDITESPEEEKKSEQQNA